MSDWDHLDEKYLGKVGRLLTPAEQEASQAYEDTIDKISAELKINLRGYDRVSIHEHFPEIKSAFDQICALHTFYDLKGGITNEDYEKD